MNILVPDHFGGRPRKINTWFLYTHMVYLYPKQSLGYQQHSFRLLLLYVHNWHHSLTADIPLHYVYEHGLQCINVHGAPPCSYSPLLIPFCFSLLLPFPAPFYLLGTLLAVTGSVHLSPRLLVNWPPLTQPSPHPPPSDFPKPQTPRALLRRP